MSDQFKINLVVDLIRGDCLLGTLGLFESEGEKYAAFVEGVGPDSYEFCEPPAVMADEQAFLALQNYVLFRYGAKVVQPKLVANQNRTMH